LLRSATSPHNTVISAAKTPDGYDFTPMYERVKHLVLRADIAFVNQEAPLGGNAYGVSGYPTSIRPGGGARPYRHGLRYS
jgi:poly-gamma-glutamate synthesis protein (capsule biosynthesis protein)